MMQTRAWAPINYDKVGQARKGGLYFKQSVYLLSSMSIEAPFADENPPHFLGLDSIFIRKKGGFCPHSPKNHHDQTLAVGKLVLLCPGFLSG